jgi:transcriptional regulator with XRE-family HTH domain
LAQRPKKRSKKQIQPDTGPEKAFGQALREVRKSKDVSQERLALDSGLDRTYVSLIERGINSPTIRAVVRMAAILKVRPSLIVRRMEQMLAREAAGDRSE